MNYDGTNTKTVRLIHYLIDNHCNTEETLTAQPQPNSIVFKMTCKHCASFEILPNMSAKDFVNHFLDNHKAVMTGGVK